MAPLCVKEVLVPALVRMRRSSPVSSRVRLTPAAGRRCWRMRGTRAKNGLGAGAYGRRGGGGGGGCWEGRGGGGGGGPGGGGGFPFSPPGPPPPGARGRWGF